VSAWVVLLGWVGKVGADGVRRARVEGTGSAGSVHKEGPRSLLTDAVTRSINHQAGNVTYGDVLTALPFGNTLAIKVRVFV
jgi:hypothetical protein